MNGNNDLCFCETGTERSVEVLKVKIWTQGRVRIVPELSDRSGPAGSKNISDRYFQAIYRWLKKVASENTRILYSEKIPYLETCGVHFSLKPEWKFIK
jgi:hypothetical protein